MANYSTARWWNTRRELGSATNGNKTTWKDVINTAVHYAAKAVAALITPLLIALALKYGIKLDAAVVQGLITAGVTALVVFFVPNSKKKPQVPSDAEAA